MKKYTIAELEDLYEQWLGTLDNTHNEEYYSTERELVESLGFFDWLKQKNKAVGYYVTRDGREGLTLFLVNRKVTKKQWWTTDINLAIAFRSKEAAEFQMSKLRYGNVSVIESIELDFILKGNFEILVNSEHPFSSEGLGQW